MAIVSGTVYRSQTEKRLSGATVKASSKDETFYATTDKDGKFNLDIKGSGTWELTVLHEGSIPKSQSVNIDQAQSDIAIYINRLAGEDEQTSGKRFFWVTLSILGILIIFYILLHLTLQQPTLSTSLEITKSLARDVNDSFQGDELEPLKNSIGELMTSLGEASNQAMILEEQVNEIREELTADQLTEIQQLTRIQAFQRFEFWRVEPLRFLEILFWGLAGILVNKVILTGWYIRSKRFYKEGIIMHIAHIATTPLLVLVVVLLFSLVTLNFTLTGDNEITIDLSDPRIMVAFAFIIGTSPWPLWKLIENAAKRFTSQFE